ncbi:MAG TPA: triose-phosphate isomerase [Candidatus Krumholzibacteria bacterium]|nr:triose-phosphate isomerase [Candidatus Krumholzibacteria bacterium]
MARRPLLMGNWKMNLGLAQARELAETLVRRTQTTFAGPEMVVCPSFVHIPVVAQIMEKSAIEWGGQDCVEQEPGAVTGGVSAEQLREIGAKWVILGHSERRQIFQESDASVREKVKAAFRVGLTPVVCVGETLSQRESGRTEEVVSTQVHGALEDLRAEQVGAMTIAYEPVWAIGTGHSAEPDDVEKVHALVRGLLAEASSAQIADGVRILYGGSVNEDNVADYMACEDVDGALVGGASLDPERFLSIVRYQDRPS